MKNCPHCAEEIQDAAIVCKHCGRDLAKPSAPVAEHKRRKRWPWILGGLILLVILIQWSRADYLEFAAKREDWHRRCDVYLGTHASINDPDKRDACQREAEEMIAYAKQKGWSQ